jgi:hypothetical protein
MSDGDGHKDGEQVLPGDVMAFFQILQPPQLPKASVHSTCEVIERGMAMRTESECIVLFSLNVGGGGVLLCFFFFFLGGFYHSR